LVVHHAEFHADEAKSPGLDPADYLSPPEIAAALDDGWTVETLEHRDRTISGGSGAHHSRDVVLRAVRKGSRADLRRSNYIDGGSGENWL
jgi:hypothetical protein